MYFHSLADFLAMGGHGFYVWTAYGIALVVVLWHFVWLHHQNRQIKQRILRQLEREASLGEIDT